MGFIKRLLIIGTVIAFILFFVIPIFLGLFLSGAVSSLFPPSYVREEEKQIRASYYGDSWKAPEGWTVISYEFNYTAPSISNLSGSYGPSRVLASDIHPREFDQYVRSSLPSDAKIGSSYWTEGGSQWILGRLAICGPGLQEAILSYEDMEGRYKGYKSPEPTTKRDKWIDDLYKKLTETPDQKILKLGLRYKVTMSFIGKLLYSDCATTK